MSRSDLQEKPPYRAVDGAEIHYGKYRYPIPRPNIKGPGRLGRLRLKEWHYTSLTTDRLFIGFGLVQLGYMANAFCYLVDRDDPSRRWEYEKVLPFGLGLTFAPSSVQGVTQWRLGDVRIRAAWDGGFTVVDLDVPLSGERLRGSFRCEADECLALLHELEPGRPAYTHKAAALPASGSLSWRGEQHSFDDGLGSLDWTRSVARRETRWKWAAFSGRLPDGRRVGLNLSAEVYDNRDGDSEENALWLDGRAIALGGVRFEVPGEPAVEPWRVHSRAGDEVDLEFRPFGARAQKIDAKLVVSDFVQPYGEFKGRIAPVGGADAIELDGIFGVVEDHLARW